MWKRERKDRNERFVLRTNQFHQTRDFLMEKKIVFSQRKKKRKIRSSVVFLGNFSSISDGN